MSEKIETIEDMVLQQKERIVLLEERYRNLSEVNEKILEKLDKIDNELTRYKGFLGGVALVGGSIITVISIFKEHLIAWFHK